MYTAYYDASGTERDRSGTLTLSGLVSTDAAWRGFNRDWQKVLKTNGVPFYRSVNFVHSREPFQTGWRTDETRREAFFGALVGVMVRHLHKAFTVQLVATDFDAVNQAYNLRARLPGAYYLVLSQCSVLAEQWIKAKHKGSPVLHVAEQGDTGQTELSSIRALSEAIIHLEPKVDATTGGWRMPYQAADLYAYTCRISKDRPVAGSPLSQKTALMLRAFPRLGKIPHRHGFHDAKTLTNICKNNAEWFPRRA